jgi:hypothetical protein
VVCWFDPKLEELSVNRRVGLVSSVPHERNMKVASRSGSPAGSRCDRSVICDNRLGSRTGGGVGNPGSIPEPGSISGRMDFGEALGRLS